MASHGIKERLAVLRLSLSHYRNYDALNIRIPEGRSVVITGSNGSGKTNLLEAISLLTPGRGLRHARLSVLQKQPLTDATATAFSSPWAISAEISAYPSPVTLGTCAGESAGKETRIIRIEGSTRTSQQELSRYFSVCYLTPQMDRVFIDGSSSRRSFLDRLTAMFLPGHIRHLSIYDHARSERMKLLRQSIPDHAWLNVLEQRMAEQAITIAAARLDTIHHLQRAIDESTGAFPKALLGVSGSVETDVQYMPALQAEERLRQQLCLQRREDGLQGKTQTGTHTSDFIVTHEEKGLLADVCSTGEQKALLISITLASVRARTQWHSSIPVLLMDEVVAHLDSEKREAFFAEIQELNAQCWLTGTDTSFFSPLKGSALFLTIENSKVLV